MTYELAKKLKDAGFPQEQHIPYEDYAEGDFLQQDGELVYVPILSELIEACTSLDIGDYVEFRLTFWKNHGEWVAQQNFDFYGKGSTPEEAVANLWLELNNHA